MRGLPTARPGDERIIKRFLWLPLTLRVKGEGSWITWRLQRRWLESCYIRQYFGYSYPMWISNSWED